VRVEGVGYVEVVGYEVFDPVALDVALRLVAGCCYVCAAEGSLVCGFGAESLSSELQLAAYAEKYRPGLC